MLPYRVLLGLWSFVILVSVAIAVWSRLIPDHGNEAPGIAFVLGLLGTVLSIAPVVGIVLILRHHPRGGGIVLVTFSALALVALLVGMPSGRMLPVLAFLSLNAWAGFQAFQSTP